MKLTTRFAFVGLAALMVAVLAACGTSGGTSGGGTTGSVESDGENLAYKPTTLSVAAGQAVTVTFKNSSTSQQHNWVLIKGGDAEAQKVDDAAVEAGEAKNYVPADPNVVSSVNILAPGASGTASVNVPAGSYIYICTFPGHYAAGMKGTLTAQ